ncbi:hypothetical protein AsFcp4_247 [Aeromonas phage AsFcp_4]|uniref:Uncharacterized protein n=1 Tax=Aeromonas phage PX29 TaxID=926067 RepID=E5DQ24_9CAUD|nr:hypothetical protein CL89_gp091 [Aeromonas phage PX29]ADQ52810.1 conserved hypothetical protein [Aeromonas phage PX29]QAX98354.1 hypothetical protein ASfcp2_8 [Aeromonas phage AsFcp_2]QAX99699.1 hypothetical protein AsFcp4_247 [Aeromonas phage AsFcp_4]
MKYVFTVVVPTERYISITNNNEILLVDTVMKAVAVRSKAGDVIGFNATTTIEDFKKACRLETKLKNNGFHVVIRKVD